jgi:hypothetical protein
MEIERDKHAYFQNDASRMHFAQSFNSYAFQQTSHDNAADPNPAPGRPHKSNERSTESARNNNR